MYASSVILFISARQRREDTHEHYKRHTGNQVGREKGARF